jgi:hypothetical protein
MEINNHIKSNHDNLSFLWFSISKALPPVRFFLYFKNRHQFPNKTRKALIDAIIGIPLGIVASYLLNTYILH